MEPNEPPHRRIHAAFGQLRDALEGLRWIAEEPGAARTRVAVRLSQVQQSFDLAQEELRGTRGCAVVRMWLVVRRTTWRLVFRLLPEHHPHVLRRVARDIRNIERVLPHLLRRAHRTA